MQEVIFINGSKEVTVKHTPAVGLLSKQILTLDYVTGRADRVT